VKDKERTTNKIVQPFLKWAGNKRSIINRIIPLLPEGKRLVEPFCGSAAVFLNTNFEQNLIADTNPDLINLYLQIQNDQESFTRYCKKYFTEKNNDAEKYYEFQNLREFMSRDRDLGTLRTHLAGPQMEYQWEDFWIFSEAAFDIKTEYFFIEYDDYALLNSNEGLLIGIGLRLTQ